LMEVPHIGESRQKAQHVDVVGCAGMEFDHLIFGETCLARYFDEIAVGPIPVSDRNVPQCLLLRPRPIFYFEPSDNFHQLGALNNKRIVDDSKGAESRYNFFQTARKSGLELAGDAKDCKTKV